MRIFGFQRIDWQDFNLLRPKMLAPTFSTWRWPRKDKDWQPGEIVQVVIKPRLPLRVVLGCAKIVTVESRGSWSITDQEAQADGFVSAFWLNAYLCDEQRSRQIPITTKPNKLMLEWQTWLPPMILYSLDKCQAVRKYPLLEDVKQ